MPTDARKVEGYSDISEEVLAQTSIIKAVSRKDILGAPGTTTVKVYVNELATIADYVPGTGVSLTNDSSSYVTINNLKEKAVNELLDGYTIETAPTDHVVQRLEAAMKAHGEQIDTDGFEKMVTDGTIYVDTAGLKPTDTTIYQDIADLAEQLDNVKAPQSDRNLVITPEMRKLITNRNSGIVLDTDKGDMIQQEGWIGRFYGFDIYMTVLMPTGVNMIANQDRSFVFGDNWTREVLLQSLNGSGQYIGDSSIQGRWAYITGAVRPTLIQVNQGAA